MRKAPLRLMTALLLSAILFVSCRKNQVNLADRSTYTANIVDSMQAVNIASRITSSNMFDPGQPDANRIVQTGITIRDFKNNPSFYIFSYADNGFVIIAAERNMYPVLAYSKESKLEKDKLSPGLMNWMQKTIEAVELVRKGMYDNRKEASAEWAFIDRRLHTSDPGSTSMKEPPIGDPCATIHHVLQNPLLPVRWGQGCLYNGQCPPAVGGPCGFAFTGCVATAMAQLMRFHQRPTSYNWAGMPTNSGNAEVERLMRDAGNSVGMNWTATGSGAPHSAIDDALKNSFGYRIANDVGYNRSRVLDNISTQHPVILSGWNGTFTTGWWIFEQTHYIDGHTWVCDGSEIFTNPCMSIIYLHMNWGWHEFPGANDHTGWYRDFDWNIPAAGVHFQYNKRAIIDIIP
jgi:hypothetical protein